MANNSADRPLCRYFASGCCTRDNCSFLHDRSARPDNVCRYYQLGQCFYGDGCRYDHVASDRSRVLPRVNNTSFAHQSGGSNKDNHTGAIPKPRFHVPCAVKSAGEGEHQPGSRSNEMPVAPCSYAQAVDNSRVGTVYGQSYQTTRATIRELCQYAIAGICPIGDECAYFHGDLCEICHCQVLDPEDEKQRTLHEKICTEALERDMEFSFAVQQSAEKVCSICMDNVLDKGEIQKQRFGILENCGHTFCFECIMNWRKQSKETLDSTTLKSCPECRIHSDYVVPSKLWPETKDARDKVIKDYKAAMGKKQCRNFDNGKGKCPFGGACWFLHALKDGTKVNLPVPKPKRRLLGADGLPMFLDTYQLSDFLDFSGDEDDVDLDDDQELFYDGVDDFYDVYGSSDSDDSDGQEGREHLGFIGMLTALNLLNPQDSNILNSVDATERPSEPTPPDTDVRG